MITLTYHIRAGVWKIRNLAFQVHESPCVFPTNQDGDLHGNLQLCAQCLMGFLWPFRPFLYPEIARPTVAEGGLGTRMLQVHGGGIPEHYLFSRKMCLRRIDCLIWTSSEVPDRDCTL